VILYTELTYTSTTVESKNGSNTGIIYDIVTLTALGNIISVQLVLKTSLAVILPWTMSQGNSVLKLKKSATGIDKVIDDIVIKQHNNLNCHATTSMASCEFACNR